MRTDINDIMCDNIEWKNTDNGIELKCLAADYRDERQFHATITKGENGYQLAMDAEESLYARNDYALSFDELEQAKHVAQIAFDIYRNGIGYGTEWIG